MLAIKVLEVLGLLGKSRGKNLLFPSKKAINVNNVAKSWGSAWKREVPRREKCSLDGQMDIGKVDKIIENTPRRDKKTIFLFDVDGTLTESRSPISRKMKEMLKEVKKKVLLGFVGGSDLSKQKEQIGDDLLELFDYGFPENGLSFYKKGALMSQKKIINVLGEELLKEFSNFVLEYLTKLEIPMKRGKNFVEHRNSTIHINLIGRRCNRKDRRKFLEIDERGKFREKMVAAMRERFKDTCLVFSIGGEVSIDCFPKGWDKTYCLRHIKREGIENVYFFGNMTQEGGNDYEIYIHKDVHGTTVKNPDDTYEKVRQKLKDLKLGDMDKN
ncbi:phosphomannomutase [Encephalitozoon intestinalis]|nr:phosphomannomutase [Encephalitozoon intestinalis]